MISCAKLEMVAWFHEPGRGVKAEPDAVGEERTDKDQGNLAVCEDELQNTVTVLPSKANSTEGLVYPAVVKRARYVFLSRLRRLSSPGKMFDTQTKTNLKQFRPKPGSLAVDDDDDCRRAGDWLASLSEAVVVMDFSKVPFALTILQVGFRFHHSVLMFDLNFSFSVEVWQNEWASTLSIGKQPFVDAAFNLNSEDESGTEKSVQETDHTPFALGNIGREFLLR
ncbi:hypothetical protein C8F01DRAFT_1090047 [Mycena amicta]|nr:hypothetical protein C8F01DRAFT_1090047 [Mycena amicta]